MFANDPGLGNKYKFVGGHYNGRIGYWAGAGDEGVFIDWEGGGQDCVRYSEFDEHAEFVSSRP